MSTISKARQAEIAQERADAVTHLREILKPGDTVTTVLRHVARSGMSRSISAMIPGTSEVEDITYWAARAMGDRIDQNHGGVIMGGCGMDMGFALVYNLARTLWPQGHPCTGEAERPNRCPSNDHSNGERTYSPELHHRDGGYALRQRWL